jgi:hypothetical protein
MVTEQADLSLCGVWRNQLGSVLELRADPAGRITGSIESRVGGVEGQYPVSGFFERGGDDDGTLGFVVAWSPTGSVASWCGRYEAASGTISAMWILTEPGQEGNEWQATRIGYDTFVRQPYDPTGEGCGDQDRQRSGGARG